MTPGCWWPCVATFRGGGGGMDIICCCAGGDIGGGGGITYCLEESCRCPG
jgi:hypothetical protein